MSYLPVGIFTLNENPRAFDPIYVLMHVATLIEQMSYEIRSGWASRPSVRREPGTPQVPIACGAVRCQLGSRLITDSLRPALETCYRLVVADPCEGGTRTHDLRLSRCSTAELLALYGGR